MKRKPVPRTEDGFWQEKIRGLEEVAIETVNKLCDINPNTHIIDIEAQFLSQIRFQFSCRMMEEM